MSTIIGVNDSWRVLTHQSLQSTGVDDPIGFAPNAYDDTTAHASVLDTFNRANSTTTLGNADTGEAWTALAGTWGISSNKAYLPTTANDMAAVLDVGASDGVFECDLLYEDAGDGILFRADGSDQHSGFLVYLDNTQLNVLVPGFGAHVTGSPLASAHTPGNTYTLKVELSGTSIKVYEGGVLKLSATDSTNLTETKFGLRSGGTTAAKRWDNLSWVPSDTWATAPGAFGSGGSSTGLVCPFTHTYSGLLGAVLYQTEIGINGEAYYRKHVGAVGGVVTFKGWIDNWIWVFVNGTLAFSAVNFSGSDGDFTFTATLPLSDNVIAVRTRSTGDEPSGSHIFAMTATTSGGWSIDIRF